MFIVINICTFRIIYIWDYEWGSKTNSQYFLLEKLLSKYHRKIKANLFLYVQDDSKMSGENEGWIQA